MTDDDTTVPPFATAFTVEAVGDTWISVLHADGHWWRFAVAEKNGRLQLVHDAHRPGPAAPTTSLAVDAYDAATLAARERGMVD